MDGDSDAVHRGVNEATLGDPSGQRLDKAARFAGKFLLDGGRDLGVIDAIRQVVAGGFDAQLHGDVGDKHLAKGAFLRKDAMESPRLDSSQRDPVYGAHLLSGFDTRTLPHRATAIARGTGGPRP